MGKQKKKKEHNFSVETSNEEKVEKLAENPPNLINRPQSYFE